MGNVITDKRLIAIVHEFASADVTEWDLGNNVVKGEITVGDHQVCQMFTTLVAFFPGDLMKFIPNLNSTSTFYVYTKENTK